MALVAATLVISRSASVELANSSGRAAVRQAMSSLKSSGMGLGGRLLGEGTSSEEVLAGDREHLAAFARKSERVARMLADQDPGEMRLTWLFQSARMRLAAGELAEAARNGDRLAMLTAARRLDTTCVRCHEVIRQ
jgi:hypothetical protein